MPTIQRHAIGDNYRSDKTDAFAVICQAVICQAGLADVIHDVTRFPRRRIFMLDFVSDKLKK